MTTPETCNLVETADPYQQQYFVESGYIAQVLAGDKEAFTPLVQMHTAFVARKLQKSGCHVDSIEDLTQQTFLRAWSSLSEGKFEDKGFGIGRWLGRVAHNLAMDEHRRKKRKQFFDQPIEEMKIASQTDIERDITEYDAFDYNVRRCLSIIPASFRSTFYYIAILEKSYDEVAELLGIPLGTVRSRLHRARQALIDHPESANLFVVNN